MAKPTPAPLLRRPRSAGFTFDKEQIAQRVVDFYNEELGLRGPERDLRLQRYAKYRMWTGGKNWPWEGSSDIAVPDMMTDSFRVQDTLNNAVMSARPIVVSQALKKAFADKQEMIDQLHDHQLFNEQDGETFIGEIIESFVNDGTYFVFLPWVKEKRETRITKAFQPLGDGGIGVFEEYVRSEFPEATVTSISADGWDWVVKDKDETVEIRFYTGDDERIEMVVERDVVVYDGPKHICKDYDDVYFPARAANLQMPSASNPNGAAWVLLRDMPTYDEIARLQKSGYYDLLTQTDLDEMAGKSKSGDDEEEDSQKDHLQGVSENLLSTDDAHQRFTRLMCFDIFDIDGDGKAEDVIWWVCLETKKVLRARVLSDVFPSKRPRRPVVARSLYPVKGRVAGIGMLEIIEGLHDFVKETLDTMADNDAIENLPFFFYRPFSGLKGTERVHLGPGVGVPLSDPRNDVVFPTRQTNSVASGSNKVMIANQFREKLTMVGDLQLGRVPQGKATALRSATTMQMLAGQGEARPERILRRFFGGLCEMNAIQFQLNLVFLPKDKEVRILGVENQDQSPFVTIASGGALDGEYNFTFKANVFNTSRQALQSSIEALMGAYVNQLTIQMGIMKPDGFYRILKDFGKSWGQDPDRYLSTPSPQAAEIPIFAEDAVDMIMAGNMPVGRPAEPGGSAEHRQKLVTFMQTDHFGLLSTEQAKVFRAYLQQTIMRAVQEAEMQAMVEGARAFQQGRGGQDVGGRPSSQAQGDTSGQTPLNGGDELLDETMPGAGGGANP